METDYVYEDMPSNELRLYYLDNPESKVIGTKDCKYIIYYERTKNESGGRKDAERKKTQLQIDARRNCKAQRRRKRISECLYLNGDAESLMGD